MSEPAYKFHRKDRARRNSDGTITWTYAATRSDGVRVTVTARASAGGLLIDLQTEERGGRFRAGTTGDRELDAAITRHVQYRAITGAKPTGGGGQ